MAAEQRHKLSLENDQRIGFLICETFKGAGYFKIVVKALRCFTLEHFVICFKIATGDLIGVVVELAISPEGDRFMTDVSPSGL